LSEIDEQASGLPRQFFEMWRSYENFTSAEVISLPSWNRTPVLSLIVQVRPSADVSGAAAASQGT